MLYGLQSWAKTTFRANIFAEQIFAELNFAIVVINSENKFCEAYKILNKRENFCPAKFDDLGKKKQTSLKVH